jgi:hypothetical protein
VKLGNWGFGEAKLNGLDIFFQRGSDVVSRLVLFFPPKTERQRLFSGWGSARDALNHGGSQLTFTVSKYVKKNDNLATSNKIQS